MDKIFAKTQKNLNLGIFKPSKPSPVNLFAKIGICHFSYFMMWNFMENKRKNWWSRDLAFQANVKRNEAKLIGNSCQGGCPTYFYRKDDIYFQLQYGGTFL